MVNDSRADDLARVSEAARRLRCLAEKTDGQPPVWKPAWSSAALEKTVKEILEAPSGQLTDLFIALWDLLGTDHPGLTRTMANFVHDVVVLCFTQYRNQYEAEAFAWMAERVRAGCTESQAYLALLALPQPLLRITKAGILGPLKTTEFADEAQTMF
jgi:hypothetical protein